MGLGLAWAPSSPRVHVRRGVDVRHDPSHVPMCGMLQLYTYRPSILTYDYCTCICHVAPMPRPRYCSGIVTEVLANHSMDLEHGIMYYSHLRREHRPPRSHLLRPEHGPETRRVHPQAETRARIRAARSLRSVAPGSQCALRSHAGARAAHADGRPSSMRGACTRTQTTGHISPATCPFQERSEMKRSAVAASSRDRTMSLVVLRHPCAS